MAYLLIDGLGKDDARDILRDLDTNEEVHIYQRSIFAPDGETDLFEGYTCYVVSDKPLNEDGIGAVIIHDRRYWEACEEPANK